MRKDSEFGKIEISTVPLPEGMTAVNGTYTCSGRVLAANYEPDDMFRVITVNDDGTDVREIYNGKIPQSPTANGIRWMCFSDNKRVLLGDYVLEVAPDMDHPESAELVPVEYPQKLMKYPGLFRHWSEIIVSPDSGHIIWTMLTFTGASNFIGKLVRGERAYRLEDVHCISTRAAMRADPEKEGYVVPQTLRGGEVKQFVHGGRAISLVGNSDCISDSVIEELDTGKTMQFSQTSGYEETAIFSPDETAAICMSPRFSPATDCSVIGMVPLPHSAFVRAGIINPAYNYAIASQRQFRMGNIGPALVDAQRTMQEGRGYQGVDLSDPENRFVYVSPMSWAPCSTKAMWNEHTRASDPEKLGRLRVVKLLDKKPSEPVPPEKTPDESQIPYAVPLEKFLEPVDQPKPPYRIAGKHSGEIVCAFNRETGCPELHYDNFSDDGRSFYNGMITAKTPPSMFDAGDNIFTGDVTVAGEHTGELKARVVFTQKSPIEPIMLALDGPDASSGYAVYDGVRVDVKDMMP